MSDERDNLHRILQRELNGQAERLKVRRVIARGADGVDEALNIIQIVTNNGIDVYVERPSRADVSLPSGQAMSMASEAAGTMRDLVIEEAARAVEHERSLWKTSQPAHSVPDDVAGAWGALDNAAVAIRALKSSPHNSVSLPWQVGAYIKLGVERDKMDPEHVAIVQDFIGPNPPSDTDSKGVKK